MAGPTAYDPFLRGCFPVGVRTKHAWDAARNRNFPCEIWYPAAAQHTGQDVAAATQDALPVPWCEMPRRQMAVRDAASQPDSYPLIIFSHSSGGGRRQSTFLCTHLASHGYVVAAMDHSELVAGELARKEGESAGQRESRGRAWIASRVPDICFLLDHLLRGAKESDIIIDPTPIGIVGHSFGGWTALATPEVDRRIQAVVALAPAGSSKPRPGILPATLTFNWGREVPTLYLVAENDTSLPLQGMYELFERTPGAKRMIILRRADHLHFMDDVEQMHETVRAMPFPPELSWMKEMRPITELCSGAQANILVRGLTLGHLDWVLKKKEQAHLFLAGGLAAELAARGLDAIIL